MNMDFSSKNRPLEECDPDEYGFLIQKYSIPGVRFG